MAFGWLTRETKSFYVARPSEYANDLVYLHPDKSIPRGTKLTVRSNECALFFREGRYVGRVDAGSVLLDTANIPFLGHLLIDSFTGANHYICEIFFVTTGEKIFTIPSDRREQLGGVPDGTEELTSLGQYKDKNSAKVVSINGRMSYTVKVQDPLKLVVEIGGQSRRSGQVIEEIVNGRMLNLLRKTVGEHAAESPVLEVVSNAHSEAFSQRVMELGSKEFIQESGLQIIRPFDLVLRLDAQSYEDLRQFGDKESELKLQQKGMLLTKEGGFAEFNLIQGQRAALEGLGKGLGSGNGPVVMTGLNLGANLTGASARLPTRDLGSGRPGTILSGQPTFVLKDINGETGPFSPRQIALLAISKGKSLSELTIRGTEDSEDTVYSADMEPQIVAEYKRRVPALSAKTTSGKDQAFEFAFTAAARDGVLSLEEVDMLAQLAVTLGLDGDVGQGRARAISMARERKVGTEGGDPVGL